MSFGHLLHMTHKSSKFGKDKQVVMGKENTEKSNACILCTGNSLNKETDKILNAYSFHGFKFQKMVYS